MYDELSVSFDNPATDPLGHNPVEGKLYCGRDAIELQFKTKDRAFRRGDPIVVPIDYAEVEKVEYLKPWFQPKRLIFQTRNPEKLAGFPGASVGRIELYVLPESRRDAAKVAELIRFRQSEAFLAESESRLQRLRSEEP